MKIKRTRRHAITAWIAIARKEYIAVPECSLAQPPFDVAAPVLDDKQAGVPAETGGQHLPHIAVRKPNTPHSGAILAKKSRWCHRSFIN